MSRKHLTLNTPTRTAIASNVDEWWECKGMVSAYDLLKWELFKKNKPDEFFAVLFAAKLRVGKRTGISVFKFNKMHRVVDRVWQNVGQEFKKLNIK